MPARRTNERTLTRPRTLADIDLDLAARRAERHEISNPDLVEMLSAAIDRLLDERNRVVRA